MANAQRSDWSSWVVVVLSMLFPMGSGSRYLSLVQNLDSCHRITRWQDLMKFFTASWVV